MRFLACLAAVLSVGLIGCGPAEEAPSYVTPLGVSVWDYGRQIAPEEIDGAVRDTLQQLGARWGSPEATQLALPAISILDADEYYLDNLKVAGNTAPDGSWVYVGAQTRELSDSALVHELVHAFDLVVTGTTDSSHVSWKDGVYDGIAQVNQKISERAQHLHPKE